MPFSVYVTDDWSSADPAPVLVVMHKDQLELPAHPHGGVWTWAFTSTEEPQKALAGGTVVRQLKAQGAVIVQSSLDRLLKLRSARGP